MIEFYFSDSDRKFFSNSPYVPRIGDEVKLRLHEDSAVFTKAVVEHVVYEYTSTDSMTVKIRVKFIGLIHPLGGPAFEMIQAARENSSMYERVPDWPR